MPGDVAVERVEAERRFVARLDGRQVGVLAYAPAGAGVLDLLHTEVDPSARGQGVGEALVEGVLAELRARGERMIPSCPFVREYLKGHPEARSLVAA